MKNTEYFKGKKITVIGLARSGEACANLLFELGAEVSVTDNRENDSTRSFAKKLKSERINVELGRHTRSFLEGRDLAVVSPGVGDESPALKWAKELNIPAVSEIEIGYLLCPAKIIAVTGSSGKTTVTTLIGKIIEASGKRAVICGNIGNPFCGELRDLHERDYVSLEVSSFQLEKIEKFKPFIALILNVSRNHLDRYNSMQEYIAAKKRIFMNQERSDFLVLNKEDKLLAEAAAEARSKIVYFSRGAELNPNQAAAATAARILGIDEQVISGVFSSFKGLEHRMEDVSPVGGVRFINDSKATTAESCLWALENINSPVFLIAGGKDKGVDYSLILNEARKKVKEVILIGEARNTIRSALSGSLRLDEAGSLKEAVEKAFSKASIGDCILLSPMCSSFDMFANYEERGKAFKEAVAALAGRKRQS